MEVDDTKEPAKEPVKEPVKVELPSEDNVFAALHLIDPILDGLSDVDREATVTWLYRNRIIRTGNND